MDLAAELFADEATKQPPEENTPLPLDVVVADSIDQFARRTSLGRTSVYYLIKRRELRAVKSGRRTLIPRAEILRFVEMLNQEVA